MGFAFTCQRTKISASILSNEKKKSIIITDISKKELIIKKKKITTLLVKAIMIPQPFRVSI